MPIQAVYWCTVTCWGGHVETLLLSSIHGEDNELVELDAVLEGQPGMHAKAMVSLAIHANPQILGVHFMHNLVPLHLRLANDEATEQLICLLGFCNRKIALGLEDFLVIKKLLLALLLLGLSLVVRELE